MVTAGSERKARRKRKIIWFIDDTVNFTVLVALLILLAYGCYSLWDSKQVYSAASAVNYEIYKPSSKDTRTFDEFRKENEDVFGWLTVYGTGIDYPLVQGEDNWEYLNKAADGTYNLAGSIFIDSENSKDFTDYNTLIHGHHMDQSAMFGDVSKFAENTFFDDHRYGNIFVNGRDYGVVFFAYILADAYDDDIFVSPIQDVARQKAYLKTIETKAMHVREAGQNDAKQIVLLSTCSSDMTNGRSVLVGYLTDQVYANDFVEEQKEKEIRSIDRFIDWSKRGGIPLWILMLLLLVVLIIIRFVVGKYFENSRIKRAMRMQSCEMKGNDYDKSSK